MRSCFGINLLCWMIYSWYIAKYISSHHDSRFHNDATTWKLFPLYLPVLRGFHQSPLESLTVTWSFVFSLLFASTHCWKKVELLVIWCAKIPAWRHCNAWRVLQTSFEGNHILTSWKMTTISGPVSGADNILITFAGSYFYSTTMMS